MNITFLTGNKNKLEEAEKILGITLKHADVDVDEIQDIDPTKVADHKVMQAWEVLKEPVFVFDTSLSFDALNGFPGPLIKWFWTTVGLEKVCTMIHALGDSGVSFEVIVSYYDGKEEIQHFQESMKGTVPFEPRGTNGWGWDPIFIPEGHEKTYAEMSPEEYIHIRAHGKALEKFRNYLER